MKKLFFIPFVFLLSFCASKKNNLELETTTQSKSNCPVDGTCTISIFRNKQLEIKSDEFGSTYYSMNDSEKTAVIVYRYKRNPIENVEDSGYTEEIIFEIDNSAEKLSLKDIDLQQTKMIFGRLCFCRGQTGYYRVKSGSLKLEQIKNKIQIDLDFKIKEVPQIIKYIKETI